MAKKSSSKPPSRTVQKELGTLPPKKMPSQKSLGGGMGNVETGFIQKTPKKATAAMMGRTPPSFAPKSSKSPASKGQFKKARGKKVF